MQDGSIALPMKYPNILGFDTAGTVEEVGPGVERFKKGDRIIAYATLSPRLRQSTEHNDRVCGLLSTQNHTSGGFQNYTVTLADVACFLPDDMPFEQGVVLPIAIWTAADGLFDEERLALSPPSVSPKAQNKTVVVWGGSSSVGAAAIQLLRNAGYDVLATASPRNHDFVKSLGASVAVDYNSPSAVTDIGAALKDKAVAGILDCISSSGTDGTIQKCIQILLDHPNAVKRLVTVISPSEKEARDGVYVRSMFATANYEKEVAWTVWRDFIPEALRMDQSSRDRSQRL